MNTARIQDTLQTLFQDSARWLHSGHTRDWDTAGKWISIVRFLMLCDPETECSDTICHIW